MSPIFSYLFILIIIGYAGVYSTSLQACPEGKVNCVCGSSPNIELKTFTLISNENKKADEFNENCPMLPLQSEFCLTSCKAILPPSNATEVSAGVYDSRLHKCPEVKVNCLCGSPPNDEIKIFTVMTDGDESSNEFDGDCLKVPDIPDFCLEACSAILSLTNTTESPGSPGSYNISPRKCPVIKVNCLCGSPPNDELKTFIVISEEDQISNPFNKNCAKIPPIPEFCLKSCNSIISPTSETELFKSSGIYTNSSQKCPDVKVNCLCGSAPNFVNKTFKVIRHGDQNSNGVDGNCSNIPVLPPHFCVKSCSAVLAPFTGEEESVSALGHTTPLQQKCPEMKVNCLCGTPPNSVVKTFTVQRSMANAFDEDCSKITPPPDICWNQSCSAILPPETATEAISERIKRSEGEISFKYPVKIVFPPADTSDNVLTDAQEHQRFRRFPQKCNSTLKPMKNAILTCWYWPNYVTCDIKCTHGHAIQENGKEFIKTVRSCHETGDYWTTFPVCEPYINCKTYLVSPGNMKCKASMATPSYCDISCLPDSEHDEIGLKRYMCADGNYAKTLPHCAAIDETVTLIKSPKK